MTAEEMIVPARALRDTDTIETALAALVARNATTVPVVDEADKLLGTFSADRLMGLLLPKAVAAGEIEDVSFLPDQLGRVREKFAAIAGDAISPHVEAMNRAIHPDTPLLEMLLLLQRGDNDLPVCDRESGKYVGIVSATRMLELIGRVG